jgi:hypothetical protein
MFQPKVLTLSEAHAHIRPHGPAEFLPRDFSNVTKHGETMICAPRWTGFWGARASDLHP